MNGTSLQLTGFCVVHIEVLTKGNELLKQGQLFIEH